MSQDAKQTVKEERRLIRLPMESNLGKVGIREDVLAVMAGIAAVEVDGVASINRNATRQLIAKLGMKSLAGGVKVIEQEGSLIVNLNLNLEYGAVAAEVSQNVQDKVKNNLENMTGLSQEEKDMILWGNASQLLVMPR